MSLLERKKILLAKIEASYGTDPNPTGAANAILVRGLNITPLDGEIIGRDLIRPYLGASEQISVTTRARLEAEVELAGAGAAGTAPAWGPLLRACAFSETITAGTDVTYAPVSSAFESVTLYFNLDGVRHILLGARGTVSFELNAQQLPVMKYVFTGLLGTIADAALPTPDYSAFVKPVPVNTTNTTGLDLHGYTSAVLSELTVDVANTVVHRQLVGAEEVAITDRSPGGSITIEAVKIADHDFFTEAKNATTGAFSITHGPATNQVVIASPGAEWVQPTYTESDGIAMLQMGLKFVPGSNGNDELTITVK